MSVTRKQLDDLQKIYNKKVRACASWAIWPTDGHRTKTPEGIPLKEYFGKRKAYPELKPHIVFLGLNRSHGKGRPNSEPWHNFHSTSAHDKMLKRLINPSSDYHGAYMTDIVTDEVDGNSMNVAKKVAQDGSYERHLRCLQEQLKIFFPNNKPRFTVICFGWAAYRILRTGLGRTHKNQEWFDKGTGLYKLTSNKKDGGDWSYTIFKVLHFAARQADVEGTLRRQLKLIAPQIKRSR